MNVYDFMSMNITVRNTVEGSLLFLGAPKMRTVHIYNAQGEESATIPQPACPFVDRLPPDHSLLLVT